MTIIEAMKQKKALLIKAKDLCTKVSNNSAHYDQDSPEYDDPRAKVKEWVQAHTDVVKEIENLSVAIQRTNLATQVSVYNDIMSSRPFQGEKAEASKEIAKANTIHRAEEEGFVVGTAYTDPETGELLAWINVKAPSPIMCKNHSKACMLSLPDNVFDVTTMALFPPRQENDPQFAEAFDDALTAPRKIIESEDESLLRELDGYTGEKPDEENQGRPED